MAAEQEVVSASVVHDETTDEEFHDAITEHVEKENNVGDQSLTEMGGKEDLAVHVEPMCKESGPHVTGADIEPATEGDTDIATGIPLPPSQEGVVKDGADEALGGEDKDTEGELVEQQVLEETLEEAEQAVVEDVPGDSGEGKTCESDPAEQVAVDDGEQEERSDSDDSESVEEELAYEAKADSIHSEEEEGEQNRSDEEEEGEQNRSDEEEEGEPNRSDEEDKAEGSGWEEPVEGGDVDEGEKKTQQPKDPSVVPRDNRYFLHDTRDGEESSEDVTTDQDLQPPEEEPLSEVDRVEKWEHDLFVLEQQAPRTEEEKQRDAWRSDESERGRGRGRGRGFRRGRGQRFSHDQRHDVQDQRQGGWDQRHDGRDQGYDNRDQRRDGRDRGYDNRDQRRDGRDQGYDNRDQRRDGRDRGYDNRDQRHDGRDRGYDNRDQRRDGRNRGYDNQDQRYDGQDQRRDGRDRGYDNRDQRRGGRGRGRDGRGRGRDQDQQYAGRSQRHDDRDQRYDGHDQQHDSQDPYVRDQRYDGRGQRQSGHHRQGRQQHPDDEAAGSWDDGHGSKINHQQQQKRLDGEDHSSAAEAKEHQEHDGKDDRQDDQPSVGRGGFIKGGSFHRGGFSAALVTKGERSHGSVRQEKEAKRAEGRELSGAAAVKGKGMEGVAMVGKGTEGAAMVGKGMEGTKMVGKGKEGATMVGKGKGGATVVGKGMEGAKDSPQSSKKAEDSSPPQTDKGQKASSTSDRSEQQSEKTLSQNKGALQKSLFGKGTSQEVKPGKERRPARVYSLARGRPTSSVVVSDTKPGSAKEDGSVEDTGRGHGTSSQPRSSKVPGSAVRIDCSEETISSAPPVEGDGEGEKGGGPKRYSVQRGSGEGGAAQKLVQGYPVFFMMPGDQSAQTVASPSNESVPQGSTQHSSGGGNRPKTQATKGQQKPLLATPPEGAQYGIPFVPGLGAPGVGGPVIQYMPPIEGMPPFAMAVDPSMMMGGLEGMGHFHGGLFIPHMPPEEQLQRMMMSPQVESPQHVRPSAQQPKQRSRAIPIVPPQVAPEGELTLTPKGSSS